MTKDSDESSESVFALVLSVLGVALLLYFLWAFGVIRDWLTGLGAAGAVLLYIVVALLVFPIANSPSEGGGSEYRQARRTLGRAIAYYGLLPGHAIGTTILGTIALPPIIALNVALTVRLRARVAIVPVLSLPALVPQLVAATQGAAAALSGDAAMATAWSGLLLTFAFVYAILGLTIVPTAIE